MLTLDDVRDKVNKKEYEVTEIPYPEQPKMTDDMSKNQYKKLLEEGYEVEKKKYRELDRKKDAQFRIDYREAVENELGKKLTDKQFDVLFNYIWQEYHSSGLYEIVNCSGELLDLIAEFLK